MILLYAAFLSWGVFALPPRLPTTTPVAFPGLMRPTGTPGRLQPSSPPTVAGGEACTAFKIRSLVTNKRGKEKAFFGVVTITSKGKPKMKFVPENKMKQYDYTEFNWFDDQIGVYDPSTSELIPGVCLQWKGKAKKPFIATNKCKKNVNFRFNCDGESIHSTELSVKGARLTTENDEDLCMAACDGEPVEPPTFRPSTHPTADGSGFCSYPMWYIPGTGK